MCQKWKLRFTTGSNGIVATGCTSSWRVEQEQLDAGRVLREEREVDAVVVDRRSEGLWLAPLEGREKVNYRAAAASSRPCSPD